MFAFLLIVQTLIAASLVATILMQRSEGGGLGVGGSSSGFMTARGAADFLTRSTAILGGVFIVLSVVMAAIAGVTRQAPTIDTTLANSVGAADRQQGQAQQQADEQQSAQANAAAAQGNGSTATNGTAPTTGNAPASPATNGSAPAVPLAQ
jgi:preprotein translocase subunit SecG